VVVSLLAVTAFGLTAYGSKHWAERTLALTRGLNAARIEAKVDAPHTTHYDSREIEGLPSPVQRYFHTVLQDNQPIITAVSIDLAGSFNMSPTGTLWRPFTSRQRVVTRRPGFLWNASISMLPGLTVRVVDGYIAGNGLLQSSILGLFSVANISGGGDIARGEFMRYFAEMLWYPTALLPSQGVLWEAVDECSANATIVDGPLTLTLLFRFNDAGLIDSFRAEARGSMVGREMVMAPWEGRWSNYQMRDGMSVPHTGEVAWMRAEGRKPYFIGSVTSLSYEFSP
jgi:hypothetical protein